MSTIFKYEIAIDDFISIEMPKGAKILTVQTHPSVGGVYIWALVDPQQPKETRNFLLRGTGHQADGCDAEKYIGTFQMYDGSIVFHLFEK